MLTSFLFLAFVSFSFAQIQVPFQGRYGTRFYFNLTIGTPGQPLNIEFYDEYESPDLYLPDARIPPYSGFNLDKSSTFIAFNMLLDAVNGTDTFLINGVTLKERPFQVINYFDPKIIVGKMGIYRHNGFYTDCPKEGDGCTSFVQSILRDQPEQILTIAYDTMARKQNYTGNLVFGSKAPSLCNSTEWGLMKEVKNKHLSNTQWTFDVDSISVGKFSWKKPGQATLTFLDELLLLPVSLYNKVMKSLGSLDMKTIPCNTTTDIVFQLGGKELRISPDVYMSKYNGTCGVWINHITQDIFEIPANYFSNHCVLFDFGDQKRVGFTARV